MKKLRIIYFIVVLIGLGCIPKQVSDYFQNNSIDISTARSMAIRLAETKTDTSELHKILNIKGSNLRSSWTFSEVNYLLASESLTNDSILTRLENFAPISNLTRTAQDSTLRIIKNNSLLFSLEEIGIHYYPHENVRFSPLQGRHLNKFLKFANIKDGESILVIGPDNSLGLLPIFLGIMYPNSKIDVLLKNERIQLKFDELKEEFSDIIDVNMINSSLVEELNTLSHTELDKILTYHNYFNKVELDNLLSSLINNMDEYTEIVMLETSSKDIGREYCGGYISNKETKKLFAKHTLIEIEDKSFIDEYTSIEYLLKVFRQP